MIDKVGMMGKIKNYAILHIMPDPPAKRILFFFSTNLSCNFPGSYFVQIQ
jgi:hypothetical protein